MLDARYVLRIRTLCEIKKEKMEGRKKESKKNRKTEKFERAEGVGQENGSLKSIKINTKTKHVDDKMHDARLQALPPQR